ncbi:RNA polymerase sigma factor [Ancylobacter pratisalsi]|uniref:Sigma-70 family RNA polymerase sigma factor n=1 Tax=Ancylobacter pratisalsi TaxID=1745854 RepID=A0A6P1YSJ0_9HYPH|nr:sigma-70 family RNA polymerase sigma factor [Ancylobacter pratisalsi]QIB36477.1 sigma-70 family RNA polymerase sigma factor [Ancylobacter pratisalsi]
MNVRTLKMGKLYEAEHSRLRSFVRRLVGNPATAEDLVQQAFTNLIGRSEDAALDGSAYITQTVRNLALNHLRDVRRRAQVELSGLEIEHVADALPSPEMATLYRSELRRLLEAIAQLPTRRREAFVLNRIEGLSYDEIAVRMGISRNTVITQVVAALAELDRRLPVK